MNIAMLFVFNWLIRIFWTPCPNPLCWTPCPNPLCWTPCPNPFCWTPCPNPLCWTPCPNPLCWTPCPNPLCWTPCSPYPLCWTPCPNPLCWTPCPNPLCWTPCPNPLCWTPCPPNPLCLLTIAQYTSYLFIYGWLDKLVRIVFPYIYIYTLLVCLFVSNKRRNGWSDRAQIFCGISLDPRVSCIDDRNFKNLPLTKLDFWKFWKSTKFVFQSAWFFYNVCKRKCSNWNRRWARSSLKA